MPQLRGGRLTKQIKDLDRKRPTQKFKLTSGKLGTVKDGDLLKEKAISFPPIV